MTTQDSRGGDNVAVTDTVYGWHFLREDRRLGYGDGRFVRKGQILTVNVEPVVCAAGLHAASTALESLGYAPGPIACYVRLSGTVVGPTRMHPDKYSATERTALGMVNITKVLRPFIRDTLVYRQPHLVTLLERAGLPEHAAAIGALDMRRQSFKTIKRVCTAAGNSAWPADRAAAWAAVRDSAWAAVWTAVRSARAAARDDINVMLEARLLTAMKINRGEQP